jgi:hypothetical protein
LAEGVIWWMQALEAHSVREGERCVIRRGALISEGRDKIEQDEMETYLGDVGAAKRRRSCSPGSRGNE